MYTWWAFVSTGSGSFMRVTVRAPSAWQAKQQLMSQYGDKLISEAALDNSPPSYDPFSGSSIV